MLKYFIFEGGMYKHEILLEFIDDVGGFVIQKTVIGLDLIMNLAIPEEEAARLQELVTEVNGKLRDAPLIGTEVAVVAPTLSRHHLPHPACDIAENLRRHGAKTNIIGLARGVGQKIVHTSIQERQLIEEHDLAVFTLGNFEHCLKKFKSELFKDLSVPVIVTGGPPELEIEGASGYVGGIGRYPERARTLDMIERLRKVSEIAGKLIEERRKEMDLDPLIIEPALVKTEVERQVPEVLDALSPNPVTLKVDGLRIKLPYDDYKDKVASVVVDGRRLGEVSRITKSLMRNYILVRILPESYFS
ncbi:MAG: methanogenesis marker 7 protein [Candidatus Methanomethyliales bacterium]|nr:methanogenesis marker 7 protein [Candidatus Methanomethylicales archaeon]